MKPCSILFFALLLTVVALVTPANSAEPTNAVDLFIMERVEEERVYPITILTATLEVALKLYRETFGVYPSGDNRAVSAALMGQNANGTMFFDGWTNQQGELLDPWKIPYSFSFESNIIVIKSAGPNKIAGDADDIVRVEKQSMGELKAKVTLKPEALEVSPGILTAFVRLPAGYPVSGITSATCDGAPAERMMPNEDGTEMIIKFRRTDIEAALRKSGQSLDTYFVVRGTWQGAATASTHFFFGVAKIKKIVGAKSK